MNNETPKELPTPRTDRRATTLPAGTFGPGNQIPAEIVLADFSRALERELATAQAKIAELEQQIAQYEQPDTITDDELAQLDVSAQEFIRWRRSLGVFTRQPFAKCAWDAARSARKDGQP